MGITLDENGLHSSDGRTIHPEKMGCKINGQQIYDYSKETGILKISASPQSIDVLLETVKKNPEGSLDLTLPMPFDSPVKLYGIKKIESIPDANGSYFLNVTKEPQQQSSWAKRKLKEANDYIRNYFGLNGL